MSVSLDLKAFFSTMPERYAHAFQAPTAERHARTVRARAQRLANVGLFSAPEQAGTPLCIVAADRPGLLAIISAAFSHCDLDVLAAEVFTRHPPNAPAEAVDLFWVRRRPPAPQSQLRSAEIRHLRDVLVSLLGVATNPLTSSSPSNRPTFSATETRLRFVEDSAGRITTVEVETNDRSGLLLDLCQALFRERVQIVGSHIRTGGGRVTGRFELVELDESPISSERRKAIQLALLTSIDRISVEEVESRVG